MMMIRDQHSEETAHIIGRYDFNKNTLMRADHQLNIQNKLRTLDSDVARAVKLGEFIKILELVNIVHHLINNFIDELR